jgi:hypothetical protein
MGGNQHGPVIGLKQQGQKVFGIKPQYGPSVRMDVPQPFQFRVENSGGFEIRQHDNMVDFPCLSRFFIDRADLACEDKMYIAVRETRSGQPFRKRGACVKFRTGFFFQFVKATLSVFKIIPQFLYPSGMGAIACSQKADALDPRPSLKACGA